MGKSVIGLLLVIGGAVAGIIGFGLLYTAVSAVLGFPSPGDRGALFGLTFGLLGGVGVAMAALERVTGERSFGVIALPAVLGVLLAILAVVILLSDATWSKMFAGGGPVILVVWALICGWLGKLVGGRP
ncbi:MAG TPA: hypothetical protein VMV26_04340 [Alphaproteobacteria bacterium]|jgi:hypothetical protein|nr:hypothetical protein [Alphaproteobacteria bacterium]